jgi:hypothetical protein
MYPRRTSLPILYPGHCEPLKAACHGVALLLAAMMGAYNAAAWLRRRQSHLAVNAVVYIAAVFWEQRHVAHHLVVCVAPPSASSGEVTAAQTTDPTRPKAA